MNYKPGIDLGSHTTREVIALRYAVSEEWAAQGLTPTITEAWRPGPSPSLHSTGLAEDYRLFDVPAALRFVLAANVSRRVGTRYQLIIEDGTRRWYYRNGRFEGYRDDKPNAALHLHGEYDGG